MYVDRPVADYIWMSALFYQKSLMMQLLSALMILILYLILIILLSLTIEIISNDLIIILFHSSSDGLFNLPIKHTSNKVS